MELILFSATNSNSSSNQNATEPVACVSNIGPNEQRKRLLFGVVAFVFGIALAALLVATNANVVWRVILFFPFAGAGIGYFQARDKT
jgi:hypothetical protein